MKEKPAHLVIANDNGTMKAGHRVGSRTFCPLPVIDSILREADCDMRYFPSSFVEKLKADRLDILKYEAEEN